jgi:hypothetical protein
MKAHRLQHRELYGQVTEELSAFFHAIRDDSTSLITQDKFDNLHQKECRKLASIYWESGYTKFYIGQGQKWINMTFKYIFTVGNQRLPGFDSLYPFCHVPLNKEVIWGLQKYGFPLKPSAWSRIADYEKYLSYQRWIREHFRALPLDVEFLLWNKETERLKDLAI